MKKRILSILLAVITVMQVFPVFALPIIAEDSSVVGSIVRFKTSGMMYAYKNVTTAKAESGDRVYASNYPETLVILDVVTVTNSNTTFYKLGTVDGSAHAALDVRPWFNAGDLEIVAPPTADPVPEITYNGQPAKEIPLFEDGKMPITATKPAELEADVRWAWEILAGDEWVRIGDKTSATCDVSYALVVNLLDENGQAKLRAVACDGDKEYPSEPVTVTIKRAPKPLDQSPSVVSAEDEPAAVYAAPMRARSGGMMRSTSTEQITITVNFIRVRADGTQEQAAYPDIRTLKSDYEAYTVTLPSVLSYYPSLEAPSNPYGGVSTNPKENTSLTTYLVDAEYTSDQIINIYYYPKEVTYTVYHYFQNIHNDQYENDKPTLVEKNHKGIVGTAVPDTIHKSDEVGFQHLYYERPEIAADGSTIVEIYYDREYFAVLFDLVHKGAYGQENLYVKYETEIGISDPKCAGWEFGSWGRPILDADGKPVLDSEGKPTYDLSDNLTADKENKFIVTESVTFCAIWTGVATTYSVVYWLENPNDGNYSVWYTEDGLVATSGGFKKWNGTIPQAITENLDYPFVSLNTTKTEADWDDPAQGVLIEGDGSSTVDVYFNRRTYNISFLATPDSSLTHNHETDPCQFNPMYCTHVHTNACTVSTHTHTADCSRSCTATEHKHTAECCDTHVHQLACYAGKAEAFTGEFADYLLQKVKDQARADGNWLALISAEATVTEQVKIVSAEMGDHVAEKAPPKNLQNGYVQKLTGETQTIKWRGWLGFIVGDYEVTPTFDVSAIYVDGQWYYYSGDLQDGGVEKAGACPFNTPERDFPNHDHTSGCTYGTKCTLTEHVHNDNCYTCDLANGTCPHQHTADCYGNVCMAPTYDATNNVTVINLQAKYGQDITAYLPYYLELYSDGLHQSGGANFVGWKYAGTGWADTGETRYVKHVTMVDELCYSEGVTATAVYDATATNAYLLYYLFESFDQTSPAKDFDLNGGGRQQHGSKWYDSDPVHVQLVMWPSAGGVVDGGEKEIMGMTCAGMTTGTLNLTIGSITSETLNAYFFDRQPATSIKLHNNGEAFKDKDGEDVIYTTDAHGNAFLYGASLKDIMEGFKTAGTFDYQNVPYPSNLEANAYVFDGWYTTPYKSEFTKVDWETATFPTGELHLYAHWTPVTRYVTVYEDATLQTQFAADNKGYQGVGHRSYAIAPDYSLAKYAKEGYKFNGWFYVDPISGEEKAFLFNFPVTQDLKIYAKWAKDVLVPYEVHYMVESPKGSGNYVKVADSIIGTAVAGQNKTFRAATGTDLYQDFQEGFFPKVGSHTIQMQINENGEPNVYKFIYDEVEVVNYWVQFVNNETGEIFDSTDSRFPATIKRETRKAAVTELFVPIEGYTVDEYSKSLIISSTEPDKNNIITFYYTKIKEEQPITAPWVVNHWIQNADGTYSVYQQTSHVDIVKPGDDHSDVYYGTVLNDILGYTFASVVIKTRRFNSDTSEVVDFEIKTEEDGLIGIEQNGTKQFGCELTEYGMEINFYYSRNKVGYRVEYKAADTGEVFHSYDIPAEDSVPHGDSVTVTLIQQEHMKIVYNEGYQLVDDTQTSIKMTLYIDESRNVITFLYQKFDATFEYQIVCDDENSGVGLSMTREVIAAGSSDSLIGAIPFESDTYYFAGWFADAACTKPINADTINSEKYSVKLVNEEVYTDYYMPRLTPTKTAFTYEGTSGNLYLSATYYALFLPRSADLTITVNSGNNDTFILTLTGKPGTFAEGTTITVPVVDGQTVKLTDMPIGEYTVTSNADWSWRYEQINTTATVVVKDGGTLTVNLTPKNNQWLTSDSSNIPKATP